MSEWIKDFFKLFLFALLGVSFLTSIWYFPSKESYYSGLLMIVFFIILIYYNKEEKKDET